MADIAKEENRQDIRIVIAGHVDHGKSTVIGRLLLDTGSLPEGKLAQIKEKCRRTARPFEYAFLLDALKDEQAQGVTIDSARCFFRTKNRNYILIDAPGHTEFIRNMVSGASRAEAAIVVLDAKEGVGENSRRHGLYLSLLGIRQVCVLVNKMDLVGYEECRFQEVSRHYTAFLRRIHINPMSIIPVSGFLGDNIVHHSENMRWYGGKTLLETMEAFKNEELPLDKPFRMPVQDVYKFTGDGDQRRIVAGTVASGRLSVGEEVVFYPSGKKSGIRSIEGFHTPKKDMVTAGYSTGFTLRDQIYVKRGELAVKTGEQPPCVGSRIRATLFWLGKKPVKEGDQYLLKTGTARTGARVEKILQIEDAGSLRFMAKDHIDRYEIAVCILALDREIAFDTAAAFPSTGRFVLVSAYDIAGGGIILEKLQETAPQKDLYLACGKVTFAERCRALGQKGTVLWFTGLSGAGKSTIAVELERELVNRGRFAYRLDGDNIRSGLNSDLGFSIPDRKENIRRIAEVAKLFCDSGTIVLVSFITPLRRMRAQARSIIGEAGFIEIYVKASLETCIERDTKGLYAKAIKGEVKNFTGISSPYEEPDCPTLVLDTEKNSVEDCVQSILDYLKL